MPQRSRSPLSGAPRRGIALLVTIILLAFLVLLMVAMSSLVRVDTKVASNQDTLAQARQNALMGLNMALAKLQETAGPDQRITARADIIENSIPANRYQMNLTGVWDPSSPLWPAPITWLVNGNEDLRGGAPNLDPDSSQSGTQSKANLNTIVFDATDDTNVPDGHPIHSAASLRRYDDVLPPAQTFNPAGKGAFRFGDGHVYLVGNGSLDIDPDPANPNPAGVVAGNSYKHAIKERVIVRKTPIIVDGGKLSGRDPGVPATPTPYTVGNYAYWIGDAGIKASLSAVNRYDKVAHDDSTAAGDGTNYLAAANSALDSDYVSRKLLNGLQLQGNRYDLLFRPEPGADDIFALGDHPPFLSVTSADRTPFYGAVMHDDGWGLLRRLQTSSQLPYLAQVTFNGPAINLLNRPDYEKVIAYRLKQLFHDVTPQTYGVLTNMRLGGLRYDLSYLSREKYKTSANYDAAVAAMPGSTANDIGVANIMNGLETYANVWRPTKVAAGVGSEPIALGSKPGLLRLQVPIVPPQPAEFTTTAGATSYPLVPVVTEFSMVGTFSTNAAGELRLTIAGEVELWNPYNATLYFSNAQSLHMLLGVVDSANGFPLKNFIVSDPAIPTPPEVNVARTIGWNGTMPAVGTRSYVSVPLSRASGTATDRTWSPGQLTKWSFSFLDRPARNNADAAISGYTPSSTTFQINTAAGPTDLSVKLSLKEGVADNDLYSVVGVNLGSASTAVVTNRFLYYFRLNEDKDYQDQNKFWLKEMNPLGPQIVAQAGSPATYSSGAIIDATTPAAPTLDAISNAHVLRNESTAGWKPAVLFDVPREDLVGVGALRHLVVNPAASTRAYAIGDSGAGNSNRVFEDFFFSTLPGDQTAWTLKGGDPLPNTSMVVFDPSPAANTDLNDLWQDATPPVSTTLTGLHSENSAQYLLVRDAFNINSTSVAAWRALLGGSLPTLADPNAAAAADRNDYAWTSPDLLANWRYYDGTNDVTVPLRNAFFRYPQTATNLGEDYLTSWSTDLVSAAVDTRRRAAYRVGIRELTNGQVDELAWHLVQLIKNNGAPGVPRPYTDLSQFVNSGVLQVAIDRVGTAVIPAYPGPANGPINEPNLGNPIPKGAPAHLSQGDILELIGHRLFARSDTFTIRVYGDVTEPTLFTPGNAANHEVPKVTSRVWLEATVQRTPIKHPTSDFPDDNMRPTNTGAGSQVGKFGRQFRILSLRWLSPDEV